MIGLLPEGTNFISSQLHYGTKLSLNQISLSKFLTKVPGQDPINGPILVIIS